MPNFAFPGLLDGGWRALAFEHFREGIDVHWLLQGRGRTSRRSAVLNYRPGAGVPRHRHAGLETIIVLEGTQSDENGDYAAGSVVLNPVGTEHSVWTEEGCVVLIQWNLPVIIRRGWKMSDIRFDIGSLHAAYASGLPVSDVIDTVYARIEQAGDPGIFIHLADKAELLAQAATLGAFDPVAKPLWGVPFAVKDNIDVAGMPTTAACAEYAYLPAEDATVVALLKAAGALVVGKTNLDQFATGPGRRALAIPHPEECHRSGAGAGRLVLGVGGGDGARHRLLRARHRHRRIRPHPCRLEQRRRAEADDRRAVGRGRRAGLPHARLRLHLRADRR